MNKLLKLSTAFILIGYFNHSAYSTAASPIQSVQAVPPVTHQAEMQALLNSEFAKSRSKPQCQLQEVQMPGFAPVPGQLNTYQSALGGSDGACGSISVQPPVGFVTTLPAGVKLLDQNNNPVVLTQPTRATFIGPMPIQPIASQPAPAPVPVTTPIPIPPSPTDSESVQWMPAQYYRFTGPRGNKIYVDDNNGNAYVQLSNGTKTNLPAYSSGKHLMRPPKYQLPGWLLAKWTKNPADNSQYFVAAGNGNSSNRMISKGPDGALQVSYTTQNQWTGPNGVTHQVPPASPVAVAPAPS